MTSFVYILLQGFTHICLAHLKLNWEEYSNLHWEIKSKLRPLHCIESQSAGSGRQNLQQFEILQKTTVLSNSTTLELLNSAALSNLTAFVLPNVAEFDSAFITENTQT